MSHYSSRTYDNTHHSCRPVALTFNAPAALGAVPVGAAAVPDALGDVGDEDGHGGWAVGWLDRGEVLESWLRWRC
jgi:hypothetical protein